MQQVRLGGERTAAERGRSNAIAFVVLACCVMGLVGLDNLAHFGDKKTGATVAAAAPEVDQAQVEQAVRTVTAEMNGKLTAAGLAVTLDARVRTSTSVIVTAVSSVLLPELQAKEVALTIKSNYVAGLPDGTFIHVYVKSPAGQELAHVGPSAFD